LSGTVFLVTIVVVFFTAAAAVYWVRRSYRAELQTTREDFREQIRELRERQTAQVERLERERKRIERTGHLDLADDLLDALDDFDNVLQEENLDEDLQEGLELIRRKLVRTLESHGIDRVEPSEHDQFDPEHHEALRAVDPDNAEPGTVVACHRAGYQFEDRTLRPAAVDVAVGRESGDTDRTDTPAESSDTEAVSTSNRSDLGDDDAPNGADDQESVSGNTEHEPAREPRSSDSAGSHD
jgi:molecular chaperone GrpE